MNGPPDPASRPSRLPLWIHITVLALLSLAFASGAVVWYSVDVVGDVEEPPFDVRPWLLLHGMLNPFLCVLFGYLLCVHIRYGWALRANWVSGLFMESVFALLILTGAGLYYAPEAWRAAIAETHHFAGGLLPVALAVHWITAKRWVKHISK